MLKSLGQALAYEAFYQIIAGQHLSEGLILPREHFLRTKFPSVLTVEQVIILAGQYSHLTTFIPTPAQTGRPTGFGQ